MSYPEKGDPGDDGKWWLRLLLFLIAVLTFTDLPRRRSR